MHLIKRSAHKRFLWARQSRVETLYAPKRNVFVSVDAIDKDASLERLCIAYPEIARGDWNFLDELDPDTHSLGALGTHIPLRRSH